MSQGVACIKGQVGSLVLKPLWYYERCTHTVLGEWGATASSSTEQSTRPPWDIEHLEAEHRFLWAKWLPERKRWGSLSCPLKIRQVSLSLEEEEEYHARSAPLTWEKLQERGRSIPPSSHTQHSNNVWRVRFMGKEAWDTMGTWAYLGLQWKWDLSWRVRGSMGERFWGARWETFRACWLQPKLGDRMESDTALLWAVTKISECVVSQSQVNQGELEMFGEFRIEQWHNRICQGEGHSDSSLEGSKLESGRPVRGMQGKQVYHRGYAGI